MFVAKLLAFPLSLVISASAAGVDMDYEGEVDVFTGEPVYTSDSDEESSNQQSVVRVTDGVNYDYEQNMYIYTVPDSGGQTVSSNVADGMITRDPVSISVDNGVTAELYLDGTLLEDIDYNDIFQYGSYSLVVRGVDSETQLFTFTIVAEKTGLLNSYQIPDGFELTEVTIEDEAQNLPENKIVKMKKEGQYQISYRCKASGVEYGLKVIVDHTPPAVKLEGVGENDKAKGAVTVSGIEEGDLVSLLKDGKDYSLSSSGVIKMPGNYQLTVTDDAGNTFEKEFQIRFYLDRQGLWFGALAAAVIIAAVVYMVMARKRLRVR